MSLKKNLKSEYSELTKFSEPERRAYEWVVGFIDGDGFLDLERTKCRDCFYFRPVLAITQKEIQILYKVKNILQVGKISKRADGYYHYRVRNKVHFLKYLIPIFKEYSFLTNKKLQFKLIIKSLRFLNNYSSKDLKKQSLKALNQIREWIKQARFREVPIGPLHAAFYGGQSTSKLTVFISQIWFVGFFDSEGCISVQNLSASNFRWRFVIKITQHKLHYNLLIKIKEFFNIGRIFRERPDIYCWCISNRRELPKLIALFKKYPLKSDKNIQWKKFLKLLRLNKTSSKAKQRYLKLISSLKKQTRLKRESQPS